MSDRETELLDRWRSEEPLFAAWGQFVTAELSAGIADTIAPVSIDLFLRIPIKARTKAERSLLDKAFYRGKGYANPYDDIEDKVGLRVVVLSTEDLKSVEHAIGIRADKWEAEKSRDFEEERRIRPFEFDYQSVHYILRASVDTQVGDVTVPAGTPCEVQIRTLLQHAYSELTHDTIYKPSVVAQSDVKRAAAKSMALIEATDDYFTEVRRRIEAASAPGELVVGILRRLYPELIGEEAAETPITSVIVDRYKSDVGPDLEEALRKFIGEKAYLTDIIRTRRDNNLLYRQPAILLLYFVVANARRGAVRNSPLSEAEIAPVYSDLGLAVPA